MTNWLEPKKLILEAAEGSEVNDKYSSHINNNGSAINNTKTFKFTDALLDPKISRKFQLGGGGEETSKHFYMSRNELPKETHGVHSPHLASSDSENDNDELKDADIYQNSSVCLYTDNLTQ